MKVVFCRYLAPEYFMFGKVSEKTDVFSFGVVLLELVTGRKPINNECAKGEENLVVWVLKIWPYTLGFFHRIDVIVCSILFSYIVSTFLSFRQGHCWMMGQTLVFS